MYLSNLTHPEAEKIPRSDFPEIIITDHLTNLRASILFESWLCEKLTERGKSFCPCLLPISLRK